MKMRKETGKKKGIIFTAITYFCYWHFKHAHCTGNQCKIVILSFFWQPKWRGPKWSKTQVSQKHMAVIEKYFCLMYSDPCFSRSVGRYLFLCPHIERSGAHSFWPVRLFVGLQINQNYN
jgi:hypothetical protein